MKRLSRISNFAFFTIAALLGVPVRSLSPAATFGPPKFPECSEAELDWPRRRQTRAAGGQKRVKFQPQPPTRNSGTGFPGQRRVLGPLDHDLRRMGAL